MRSVAILTHSQTAMFELGCAVELFALPRPEFSDWYQADVVSLHSNQIQATGGLCIQVKQIKDLSAYDMLVVPSWRANGFPNTDDVLQQVQAFHQANKRIISFCSGAFLLAEAGLLNHRHATTHWQYADRFKTQFPAIEYVDNVLYVYDGLIGCSAGSAAGLDLGIEVIRQDFGYEVANSVARRLVMSPHRKGGQSQYVETPVIKRASHFANTLDWVMENLSSPMNVDELARRSSMSRRTFDRKFRDAFDLSPKEWITHQRIQLAKQLMESRSISIESVAQQTGFENSTTFRHHFKKLLGISPVEYRNQFSS